MKEKQYCVYQHINKINGKVYIGMTGLKPNQRWQGGSGYSNQEEFWGDIQKYGWDKGFIHEVLYEDLTKEEAQIKEAEIINEFQLTDPEICYNKTCSQRILKEQIKKEEEPIVKVEPLQGVKRQVYCIELDKTFESASAAARTLDLNNSHISGCCRGERKTCGGYHWEYREFSEEPVYCLETDAFYGSISIAAARLKLNSNSIRKVCKGMLKTTGKMHFRYATIDEVKNLEKNFC